MKICISTILLSIFIALSGSVNVFAQSEIERQIQIASVDFSTSVVEVFNFGQESVDLSRWRFCSHDFNERRRYTGASGLDGVVIASQASLFIHINNDAPVTPDSLNVADLGGTFATPLDQDAFGIQFFFPAASGNVSFGNSSLIADHIQWNFAGQAIGNAEERTGQAVSVGLWSAVGDFIETQSDSVRIELVDESGDLAGDPSEYAVEELQLFALGDLNCDGSVDLLDVQPFVLAISDPAGYAASFPDCDASLADTNGDGSTDLLDVGLFVQLLTGG